MVIVVIIGVVVKLMRLVLIISSENDNRRFQNMAKGTYYEVAKIDGFSVVLVNEAPYPGLVVRLRGINCR